MSADVLATAVEHLRHALSEHRALVLRLDEARIKLARKHGVHIDAARRKAEADEASASAAPKKEDADGVQEMQTGA